MYNIIKRVCFSLLLVSSAQAKVEVIIPNPPSISSESYALLDFETGKILLEKESDKMLSPASVTKLMTTYVVLKEVKNTPMTYDDKVKISKKAVFTANSNKSSRTFLEIGDEVPINDLLKGLIVQSGNDAAIALAEYIAGNEDNFANLMNDYAKRLGMNNSQFRNASGLPIKDHYTTAKDLSILMSQIVREFPEEYEYYFGMKSYEYNDIEQKSRNQLLFNYDELFGGKTGWHNTAKYCYTGTIERDGRRLVIATLKAPESKSRFEDVVALSNYGYRYFDNHTIVLKGKPIQGINKLPVYMSDVNNVGVVPNKDITVTLRKGEYEKLKADINVNDKIIAPFPEGGVVGEIKISLNDEVIAQSELVTTEEILEGSFFDVIKDKIAISFID